MLSNHISTRYHRHVDKCPGSNILSRDCICWPSEAAFNANKIVPCLPIRFVDMSTNRALPRSISGIDKIQGDSRENCFVSNESPQLREPPIRQSRSLVPSGRCPLSDTAKILYGDSRFGAFGICNDCLRNAMIHVFLKSSLLPGNLLEFSFRRRGLLLLKIAPPMFKFTPIYINFPPAISLPSNTATFSPALAR